MNSKGASAGNSPANGGSGPTGHDGPQAIGAIGNIVKVHWWEMA